MNNDTYISLNQSTYDSLITEMIDFIKFKIESAFSRNIISSVPDCVTEDGSVFLHPHTEIELKNGDILNFDLHYTPTALSDRTAKN